MYLHSAKSMLCVNFDADNKVAHLRDIGKIDYFTIHKGHCQIRINGVISARSLASLERLSNDAGNDMLKVGNVTVKKTIYGYEKRSKVNADVIIDRVDVNQPSYEYDTQAVWSEIPMYIQEAYYSFKGKPLGGRKKSYRAAVLGPHEHAYDRGALHAVEHLLCEVAPLFVSCDPRDLCCQHTRRDGDVNRYLLLLYETTAGGLGVAAKAAEQWEGLLEAALKIICQCKCSQGCDKCIYSPACGEGNHGLDKEGAKFVLEKLTNTSVVSG